MSCEINLYNKALNYAFRLLKIRLRSIKEIRDKLKNKGYEDNLIDKVLERLSGLKLVDDKIFSLAWAKSRLNNSYGLTRIKFELKNKGISKDIIDSLTSEAKSNYNERDVINKLIEKKLKNLEGLDKIKIKQRLYNLLKFRGFNTQLILEALDNL